MALLSRRCLDKNPFSIVHDPTACLIRGMFIFATITFVTFVTFPASEIVVHLECAFYAAVACMEVRFLLSQSIHRGPFCTVFLLAQKITFCTNPILVITLAAPRALLSMPCMAKRQFSIVTTCLAGTHRPNLTSGLTLDIGCATILQAVFTCHMGYHPNTSLGISRIPGPLDLSHQ